MKIILESFQQNALKQNVENVPNDHLKIKTLQIIKTMKLKLNCMVESA